MLNVRIQAPLELLKIELAIKVKTQNKYLSLLPNLKSIVF